MTKAKQKEWIDEQEAAAPDLTTNLSTSSLIS